MRLRQLREHRAQRAQFQAGKPEALGKLAKALFGNKTTVKAMLAIEGGSASLSKEQAHHIARFYGVPLNWLMKGKAEFAKQDVIRLPGVASRIAATRIEQGLSRRGLSVRAALGDTSKNISRLEDLSHAPRLGTLQKISQALDTPQSWLIYGKKR